MRPLSTLQLLGLTQAAALTVPNRRTVVRNIIGTCALLAFTASAIAGDSAPSTQGLLRQARSQLDPCAKLIDDGNWDGVRTAVKTPPLANVRALSTKLADELGEAGNCIAGVNFGKAACARLNSYGPHAVRSLQYGKIEHRFQY